MKADLVGKRALRITLGISVVFIVLFSLLLFAFEYGRRQAEMEAEIENIRAAQVSGVVEALWNYDRKLLQTLVDGFLLHPRISYAAVEDLAGEIASSGIPKPDGLRRDYPLNRRAMGAESVRLGTLTVEVDSARILRDALGQVLISVSVRLLFLLAESFVVYYLFSRLVTRHLSRIAFYIRDFDARSGAPPLALDKERRGDELDILVESFNAMRGKLEAAREAELRAMEELRLSEARNRILIEEAPDAIMMMDLDQGKFIACNRRAEILFGRSREELERLGPGDLYVAEQPDGAPIDASVDANTLRALAGETVVVRRCVRDPRGGATMTCEVRLTIIPWEGRRVVRSSYLDISDRVRSEDAAARSLREKEVLLREVYHRTKNNMQVIAAFLSMEAMASEDGRVTEILNEMIGRIQSMSLVHQNLYESRDLSRIDLGDYLHDLVDEISRSYLADRPGVAIGIEAEPGIVSTLDAAIPCGLAVNELIVNAAKYAFPEARAGRISAALARAEPGTLALRVEDDGVGLPAGFDFRRDGRIGLQTVVALIEQQLYGTISLASGPGTRWDIRIRDAVYDARV